MFYNSQIQTGLVCGIYTFSNYTFVIFAFSLILLIAYLLQFVVFYHYVRPRIISLLEKERKTYICKVDWH